FLPRGPGAILIDIAQRDHVFLAHLHPVIPTPPRQADDRQPDGIARPLLGGVSLARQGARRRQSRRGLEEPPPMDAQGHASLPGRVIEFDYATADEVNATTNRAEPAGVGFGPIERSPRSSGG